MPYYAVANGREAGVYDSWGQCEQQVKGYSGAQFKKFDSLAEAQQFAGGQSSNSGGSRYSSNSYSSYGSHSSGFSHSASSYPRSYASNSSSNVYGGSSSGYASDYPSYSSYGASQSNSMRNSQATHSGSGHHFDQDGQGYTKVFTDGACESNGRAGAKAGYGVYFGPDHPLNKAEPVKGRPTNNVAELEAATQAIKAAKSYGIEKLEINTDSQFMIKCSTEWIPKWQKNGWKLSDGSDVKNKEQLVELDKAIKQGVDVKWKYVQAHSGIDGNERADRLAKAGAAKYHK